MKKTLKRKNSFLILTITVIVFSIFTTASVFPLSYGPSDVITAVNSLRAEYGLAPYITSNDLNGICQEQADYMASIDNLTHDREDGSSIPTTAENIAYGPINRAMDSWVDDQPHFDTLTAWSGGQVGAGISEGNSGVYICLNFRRNTDSEFNQIPFTQQPGATPIPTLEPTEEAVIVEANPETSPDTAEVDDGEAAEREALEEELLSEATPIAMVLQEETPEEREQPTEEPIEIDTTSIQPQAIAIESSKGKLAAYILMGVGVLGLGSSIYGMLWALKNMGGKDETDGKKQRSKKSSSSKKKNREKGGLPNEVQEE
jgi:hypothetical protein